MTDETDSIPFSNHEDVEYLRGLVANYPRNDFSADRVRGLFAAYDAARREHDAKTVAANAWRLVAQWRELSVEQRSAVHRDLFPNFSETPIAEADALLVAHRLLEALMKEPRRDR